MTGKELFTYLTQDAGLDDATAQAIMKAAENEKVSKKATSLIQKEQYDDLERRAAQLELDHNGTKEKPGSKAYREWYDKNYAAVVKLQQDVARYQERFGSLDDPDPNAGKGKGAAAGTNYTHEDIQKIVKETIGSSYAPIWDQLLTGTATIVQ